MAVLPTFVSSAFSEKKIGLQTWPRTGTAFPRFSQEKAEPLSIIYFYLVNVLLKDGIAIKKTVRVQISIN